jgi:hypothetical protein
VNVIHQDKSITQATMGQDMDVTFDHRYSKVNESSQMVALTFNWVIIPNTTGSISTAELDHNLQAVTVTKVLHRYGIVDHVEQTYLGSTVRSTEEAYDALTGGALVTKTVNNYDDPVYKMSIPAYWGYKSFSPSSTTLGNQLTNMGISSAGVMYVGNADKYLFEGDELLIDDGTHPPYKLWVSLITGNTVSLIDASGNLASSGGAIDFRVIRSGHENDQGASMAVYSMLKTPVNLSTNVIEVDDILQAHAYEFTDDWKTKCAFEPGCLANSVDCEYVYNPQTGQKELQCTDAPVNTSPSCGLVAGQLVNPFREGLVGNWKVGKSYSYRIDRNNAAAINPTNVRTGGTYASFTPFWDVSAGAWVPVYSRAPINSLENWLLTGETTLLDEKGNVLEGKDVLGNYSATLYGYNNELKGALVAAATNAEYTQIATDGFEDYSFRDDLTTCDPTGHFDFKATAQANNLVTEERHTGRYSLKLIPGESQASTRYITECERSGLKGGHDEDGYDLQSCDCLVNFSPEPGRYTTSVWVKEQHASPQLSYDNAEIEITLKDIQGNVLDAYSFSASGPIIEGWQRVEADFDINAGAYCIEVRLKNNGVDAVNVFFDDLRVHPFLSDMQTVVYDPLSMRVMAILNDRNFATIIEYNERGLATRTKIETTDGIKTVSEGRGGIVKDLN